MAKCGIYKIQNIENNKIYIGQSVDIAQRCREHRSDVLTNRDNSVLHVSIKFKDFQRLCCFLFHKPTLHVLLSNRFIAGRGGKHIFRAEQANHLIFCMQLI